MMETEEVFNLPEGITLNKSEVQEQEEKTKILAGKITCTNCSIILKGNLIESFGRYSGEITIGDVKTLWHGKLPSDPQKSKKQLLTMFNERVRTHLEKCKG